MNSILLTGSTGFLGSHLLHKLIREKCKVFSPIREPLKDIKLSQLSLLKLVTGNFYDENVLQQCSTEHLHAIIHLAAIRGEGHGKWSDYQRVNVYGTEQLIDLALSINVKLFVYCSTVGMYGTIPKVLPADFQTELNPDNFYHRSKCEAEQLVINKLKGKIPYIIIRPSIIYGPGDNGFLIKLIDLVRRKNFPLVRDDIKIHLLNVETLSELIALLIQQNFNDQEIINVADHEPIRFKELVDVIYSHFHGGKYPGYLKVPSWFYTLGKNFCDILKLKSLQTSMKLVSESWYYDVSPFWEKYPLKPFDTLTSISDLLEHEYP